MATFTDLIALSWTQGRYAVVAQITADVPTDAIGKDHAFSDCSGDSIYYDGCAILHKSDLARYLAADASAVYKSASEWCQSLPAEATFVIVHVAEWESGLGD